MRIIKNTSVYQTRKLKNLFGMVHYLIAIREGRLRTWKQLRVLVRNGRNSGHAYLSVGGSWREFDMCVSVGTDLEGICQLFAHELMHNYGYHHRQFRRDPLDQDQIERIKREICMTAEELK